MLLLCGACDSIHVALIMVVT